jgi:hypothetical protein
LRIANIKREPLAAFFKPEARVIEKTHERVALVVRVLERAANVAALVFEEPALLLDPRENSRGAAAGAARAAA